MDHSELLAYCIEVLVDNQRGDYTIPAGGLYPHQWLWDSCFTAIGVAHFDVPRAQKEIISLLRGQWANGMLPNMIFAEGDAHKRDRDMWQSHRSPFAPDGLATSGITQPPMLAEAIVRIGEKLDNDDRRHWYLKVYPLLLAFHEWLYNERDPHQEGLVLLIHPWESGMDNAPPWMSQLRAHHKPWWVWLVEKSRADNLANLFRRDTQHVSPGQRISNIEALLYYDVVQRLKRKNWDIERILSRSHFVVQDVGFNSILLRAHHHLQTIAKSIGHDIPDWLTERVHKGRHALANELWDPETKQFYSRNFVTHHLIKEPSIGSLLPLYAGIGSDTQVESLVRHVRSKDNYALPYPLPSVPASYSWYHELKYWQGPTWINTNWLIADGLHRAGYKKEAAHIALKSTELVRDHGAHEYFSAKTGTPAGAKKFSWTAALTIDFLEGGLLE